MKTLYPILTAILVCLVSASPSSAAVIDSSSVTIGANNYDTFLDQNTGLTWLDIDSFWDATSTYNSITSLLSGSGFHLANLTELTAVQSSIGSTVGTFTAVAQIVGGNYTGNPHPGSDRNIIWGIYEDGNSIDGVSYSWTNGPTINWQFAANIITSTTTLRSHNTSFQDLGAWIVSDSSILATVPEPSTFLLLLLGALGLTTGAMTRRQRAQA